MNPEITETDQHSLLWQCAGNRECIDLLVDQGVNIHRRSGSDAETALMRATYKGDEECVKRLLAAGADPNLEFTRFANVMLEMDEAMTALIDTAGIDWNRNLGKKASKPVAAGKKRFLAPFNRRLLNPDDKKP